MHTHTHAHINWVEKGKLLVLSNGVGALAGTIDSTRGTRWAVEGAIQAWQSRVGPLLSTLSLKC